MPLFFRIQPSLPHPAYLQIVDAVKDAIQRGDLRKGERIASIRALAQELAINPNTVARAYRELEHMGLIASYQGSGFEVCGGPPTAARAKQRLQAAVKEALRELEPDEIVKLVRQTLPAKEDQHAAKR